MGLYATMQRKIAVGSKKCKYRGMYELTFEFVVCTLAKQQWRCYYSNIPLMFDKDSPWNLSFERLDNDLGYTLDNTRFISIIFNTMGNSVPKYNITGSPQWNR
eukprot:227748_1